MVISSATASEIAGRQLSLVPFAKTTLTIAGIGRPVLSVRGGPGLAIVLAQPGPPPAEGDVDEPPPEHSTPRATTAATLSSMGSCSVLRSARGRPVPPSPMGPEEFLSFFRDPLSRGPAPPTTGARVAIR